MSDDKKVPEAPITTSVQQPPAQQPEVQQFHERPPQAQPPQAQPPQAQPPQAQPPQAQPPQAQPPQVQQVQVQSAQVHRPQGQQIPVQQANKRRLIVAPRRSLSAMAAGIQPLAAAEVADLSKQLESLGADVIHEVRSRKMAAYSAGSAPPAAFVVRMDHDKAVALMQSASPRVIVEEDLPIYYAQSWRYFLPGTPLPPAYVANPYAANPYAANPYAAYSYAQYGAPQYAGQQPASAPPMLPRATVKSRYVLRVIGRKNEPVPGVSVTLRGEMLSSDTVETDKDGIASFELFTPTGRPQSLYISAKRDYWTVYVTNPSLTPSTDPSSAVPQNVVQLTALEDTIKGFPNVRYQWGQQFMGLDQLPDSFTGKGVKIGIIDSGADTTHELLSHISQGEDFTDDKDWKRDQIGHGSHCAGVISARGPNTETKLLRGFAPDAEVQVYKVFPGGQFSNLLDALDACQANGVDVVNMSLGNDSVSEAVEQKLEELKMEGVICVVAAGNSGGKVMYPGSSRHVMAVAAMGMMGTLPQTSWEGQTVLKEFLTPDGVFSPNFTCFGPEITVAAPGVGIVSTVPGGYGEESGTSMAAPHVTGFTALLLAHHPLFRLSREKKGPLAQRNSKRVEAMVQLLKTLAKPLPFGARSGAGVPCFKPELIQQMQAEDSAPAPSISTQSAGPGAVYGVNPMGTGPGAVYGMSLDDIANYVLSKLMRER